MGRLVTAYALTAAVVSLPAARATRSVPRRHLLTAVLTTLVRASPVSGLEISLAGAEENLTQLNAALKPSVIHLSLPILGQIAGRCSTL